MPSTTDQICNTERAPDIQGRHTLKLDWGKQRQAERVPMPCKRKPYLARMGHSVLAAKLQIASHGSAEYIAQDAFSRLCLDDQSNKGKAFGLKTIS